MIRIDNKIDSKRTPGLSGQMIKLIAIASMLTDHIGCVLYPDRMAFRYIGRIAFPIFVFLVVEGFYHTGDVWKYGMRLLAFACISEIPFDLAFNDAVLEFSSQNIFFTLFLGLAMIALMEKFPKQKFLIFVISASAAFLLRTDYGVGGILFLFIFYIFRRRPLAKYSAFAAVSLLLFKPFQCFALFAAVPLSLYNGEKGKGGKIIQYLFYIFYPTHLLILWAVSFAVV